jgi:hypothetical protein
MIPYRKRRTLFPGIQTVFTSVADNAESAVAVPPDTSGVRGRKLKKSVVSKKYLKVNLPHVISDVFTITFPSWKNLMGIAFFLKMEKPALSTPAAPNNVAATPFGPKFLKMKANGKKKPNFAMESVMLWRKKEAITRKLKLKINSKKPLSTTLF